MMAGIEHREPTPSSWGHVELMWRENAPRVEDAYALRHWLKRMPTNVGSRNVESAGVEGRAEAEADAEAAAATA